MNADNLRSGAAGLTARDLEEASRGAPARRTWEDGEIACREARRIYAEVMGDRRQRETDAEATPNRRRRFA